MNINQCPNLPHCFVLRSKMDGGSFKEVVGMVREGNGVEVVRLNKLDMDSNLRAFVDVSFAGVFVIKGLKILEGKDGLFVGMPSEKGKDGRWYNTAYPLTKEFKDLLNQVIIQAYMGE